MKLGMQLGYAGGFKEAVEQVATLEKAGLDFVWVAEAYGFDAPTHMGYVAARTERVQIGSAILPIFSRTPALLAQTAAGLDYVSGGRALRSSRDGTASPSTARSSGRARSSTSVAGSGGAR